MKLKIDNIQVKDLVDTGTPQDPQDPAVRIRIGPHEMMTKRSVDGGVTASFGEMFEVDVDEYEYKDGKLEIEVEVINLGTEMNAGTLDKNIHVGSGHATVHSVIPQFDNEAYFIIDLTHFGRKGNFRKGEVLMRGFLHDPEAIREALKFKTIELENLKTSYAEFITSSTKLEAEMEEALRKADLKIQKLTKKNTTITETLTTVTNQYNSITSEFTLLQNEVHYLREANAAPNPDQAAREEELRGRLEALAAQNQDVQRRLAQSETDYRALQTELEQLYTSKYELELMKNDEAKALLEEIERLRKLSNKPDHTGIMMEMSEKMMAMAKEIQELRGANRAAGSIMYNNTYITNNVSNTTVINNQYFEYIINSTNITNVYVTNIIQNGSIEELRAELINQLRQVENLTFNNATLLSRIQDVTGNLIVCARTRPPSEEESTAGGKLCIDTSADATEMTCFDKTINSWRSYPFDKVWGYDSTQKDVFSDLEPMISAVVDGNNACIIAYGHAQSGKSFTMNGFQTADHMGVTFRSLQKVFELLSNKQVKVDKKARKEAELPDGSPGPIDEAALFKFSVDLSLVDIFNEQMVDLLGGSEEKGFKWTNVSKPADAMVVYSKSCQFAKNKSNIIHRVLQIQVTTSGAGSTTPVKSVLYLVDVMNSEQLGRDVSLTAFHDILAKLQANPSPSPEVLATIPYNKSKLTNMLKNCLGAAGCKTMIVLTVNPTDLHLKESITNLAFISKLKIIKVMRGGGASAADGSSNALELKNLRGEIKDLRGTKAGMEALLQQTKDTAGSLIEEWKAQYYEVLNGNKADKSVADQLNFDLSLTQRNLDRVMAQYREQTDINERLLAIIKIYENELAIAQRQELPLMPTLAALEGGRSNGHKNASE